MEKAIMRRACTVRRRRIGRWRRIVRLLRRSRLRPQDQAGGQNGKCGKQDGGGHRGRTASHGLLVVFMAGRCATGAKGACTGSEQGCFEFAALQNRPRQNNVQMVIFCTPGAPAGLPRTADAAAGFPFDIFAGMGATRGAFSKAS
jgi:hypothetical protein